MRKLLNIFTFGRSVNIDGALTYGARVNIPNTINKSISPDNILLVEQDDEVQGVLDVRLSAIQSISWAIDGVNEAQRLNFEQIKHDLLNAVFQSIFYGYSITQIVPAENNEIGAVISEDPFSFRLNYENGKYTAVTAVNGREVDVLSAFPTRGNNTFFHLSLYNASKRYPLGRGLSMQLLSPVMARRAGWDFWQKYMERHSIPWTWAKTQGGDLKKIADSLIDAIQDAVIVTNANVDVSLIHPQSDKGAHSEFTQAANRRIHKIILGQTLTTEIDGRGAYAAAKVHDLVRKDKLASDMSFLQREINNIVKRVYGADAVVIGTIPEKTEVDRDVKLYQLGVRFSKEYISRAYGIPEDAFELDTSAPANAQMSGEAGISRKLNLNAQGDTQTDAQGEDKFTRTQQLLEKIVLAGTQETLKQLESDVMAMAEAADSYDAFLDAMEAYANKSIADDKLIGAATMGAIVGVSAESNKVV